MSYKKVIYIYDEEGRLVKKRVTYSDNNKESWQKSPGLLNARQEPPRNRKNNICVIQPRLVQVLTPLGVQLVPANMVHCYRRY